MANDKYIELVSDYLSKHSDSTGAWASDAKGPFTSLLSNGYIAAYAPEGSVGESYISKASSGYSSQNIESRIANYINSDSGEVRYITLYGVAPTRIGEWAPITGNGGYTLLYGPYIGGREDRIIALYGVFPTPISNARSEIIDPIVTLYGPYVPGPNRTTPVQISITEEEIKQNISILKKSANTMENSWEDIKGPILKSIKESWIGKECSEYTSSIEKMNKKVTNSIEALRLLAKKYEESIDRLAVTRKSIMEAIDNL